MNTALEFISSYTFDILGYTLLHSLWQALLITIIVVVTLRIIPSKFSEIRYAIASLGLLAMIILSAGTFIYLSASSSADLALDPVDVQVVSDIYMPATIIVSEYIYVAQLFIASKMPLFMMIWMVGMSILFLRIVIGLAGVQRLREGSLPLDNKWSVYVQKLSEKLQIERLVTLAESAAIEAPVVIGYFKPFILIPVGMCTSLSTAQLETIFIHELMHIRRRDYLVNVIQSFVEAIYFFNPFIWAISKIVKNEREHCCDDAVVQLHGNVREYAIALARLEEVRLSKISLSLPLTGSRNQLMNRIKRLMEKSVKNHYSGGRIIPALLLVIGLVCASWISAQTGRTELNSGEMYEAMVVQDTTKKDKKNKQTTKTKTKHNAKSPTTEANQEIEIDETVEVEENVDVEHQIETEDEDNFSQVPPPIPDFDFDIPPIPDIAGMMPPLTEFDFSMRDFDWNGSDWEKFNHEFEEKFKSRFGEFYETNGTDIQKMMEEIQKDLALNFGDNWEAKVEEFAKGQEAWAKRHAENWEQQAEKMSEQGDHFKRLGEDLERLGLEVHEEFEKNHRNFEEIHKAFEERGRTFEKVLKEELIKDGYLEQGQKLESIQFHNGVLKINGETIKPGDQKKYDEILSKYSLGVKKPE